MSDVILIVDDSLANIELLHKALIRQYSVIVATSGECALDLAHGLPRPDLILLDILMPGMDGYEVCRRLKADETTVGIPVIFVTVKSEVEDETAGFNVGAVDYITTPISFPILFARIRTHLALSKGLQTQQRLTDELREAARLKQDVENITRHDLKNPLINIIGLPSLISSYDNLYPDQEKFLSIIETCGYQMLLMINSSLDLYKMEKQSYQFSPTAINACAITFKALRDLEYLLSTNGCHARVVFNGQPAQPEDKLIIWAEELLTYTLLVNLLKNAIEASPEECEITISILVNARPQISIHNFGAVPESVHETFFDKYATAGKTGGTGLGTYSARLIIETMGGSIVMHTSQNAGTTVTVTFLSCPEGTHHLSTSS